eukprot:TRINITY_DN3389_c0_g2_i4.p1 TRINITY_DN3389_c0_g2~~TRINITY_DN3389_c0_g2_i4.p1  ORF type:complete len:109 (+),score=12.94 TRINITY_DN3389_c0_g2_i4:141-467(+)
MCIRDRWYQRRVRGNRAAHAMGNLCRRSVYSASDSKLEQGQPSESTQTWEGPAVVFGDAVTSVAATDDRSILVAGSEDKTVILYDWVLGRVVQRWNEHRRGVRTVLSR